MSKYEKFSKEELMAIAEKQDSELASKKYGLNWDAEREPEEVVLDCENNLPVLKRVKGKEIHEPKNNGQEDNILIEGDNYHALTVLNYTHQGKIDVIYIDPPYNTGNQDFKYNDKFVDKEDGFRHSKWLNFMEKRLNLAKDLLKDTGVIFISIDDNEMAQLKMLCDRIFGQENFLAIIAWQSTDTLRNDAKFFSPNSEFILCYAKNKINVKIKGIIKGEKQKNYYKHDDGDGRGPYLLTPLHAKSGSASGSIFEYKFKNGQTWKPPQGTFPRFSKETLTWLENENRLRLDIKGKKIPQKKTYLSEVGERMPMWTFWRYEDFGSTRQSNQELSEIIGKGSFQNPKPTKIVKIIIDAMINDIGIVLDFFAGSGTTGHAVLELNKEDGGNRKFILCTNNEVNGLEKELKEKGLSDKEIQEYGICRKITYPRLEKVIKGYKKNGNGEKVEGLGGNLQYFRTALVKDAKNKVQVRIDLTQKCTEMLCVKENIFNLKQEGEDYKIFASNKGDKFLCVYYNYMEGSFGDFLKEIKKLKGDKIIYMFSMNSEVDKKLFSSVDNFVIEAIPQKILDVYKKLVKMNIPVKADTIFLEFEKANKKIFEGKEKDEGARMLRIVLEKTIQKIAQKNNFSIFNNNHKEEKIATLNDKLYESKVFNKVQWEENKTCLAIGNNASHGDYGEYTLNQVENFYQHIQTLFNDFGI